MLSGWSFRPLSHPSLFPVISLLKLQSTWFTKTRGMCQFIHVGAYTCSKLLILGCPSLRWVFSSSTSHLKGSLSTRLEREEQCDESCQYEDSPRNEDRNERRQIGVQGNDRSLPKLKSPNEPTIVYTTYHYAEYPICGRRQGVSRPSILRRE